MDFKPKEVLFPDDEEIVFNPLTEENTIVIDNS